MFEHAKKKNKKGKKPFLNFVEKKFVNSQSAYASVTTRGAGKQAQMVLRQAKVK